MLFGSLFTFVLFFNSNLLPRNSWKFIFFRILETILIDVTSARRFVISLSVHYKCDLYNGSISGFLHQTTSDWSSENSQWRKAFPMHRMRTSNFKWNANKCPLGLRLLYTRHLIQRFSINGALRKHQRVVHNGEKLPVLWKTSNSFFFKSLDDVVTFFKDQERLVDCTVCHKTMKKSSLLNHMRTQHTGEKPFKCDECGKVIYRELPFNSFFFFSFLIFKFYSAF